MNPAGETGATGGARGMTVVRDVSEMEAAERGRAITIGAFDGVHLGHQAVLRLVRELASARGLRSAVVTFDRHPAEVVRPRSAPRLLTTLEQKLELLAGTGNVDDCVVLTFDEPRSLEPAEQFVEEVLTGSLGARVIVVGDDFHFGHLRRGDVPLLKRMGADLGFEVLGLGLVAAPDGTAAAAGVPPYSSTRVRELLAAGDVEGAATILSRPHEVWGTVVQGDGRGRDLGFPTANIPVPERICLPADGVYAGTFEADGLGPRPAAVSVGRRPTFYAENGMLLLEACVLDFEGDLYGSPARVRFHRRLRGQIRFEGPTAVDDLVAQMRRDVDETRRLLGDPV